MFRTRIQYLNPIGDDWVTTLNWQSGDGLLAVNAHNATDTICANLVQCISSAVHFGAISEVQTVDEATNEVTAVDSFATADHVGTAAGDILPYTTQGLIQLKTSVFIGGRQLRGRIYVPAPTETLNSAGFPLSSYVGVLHDAVDDILGNTDAELAVYSRKHAALANVTAVSGWNNWAELRSRRNV
jgi:hypothetical protein